MPWQGIGSIDRVRQAVADRLREAGLTEETFEFFKPAIESIEADQDVGGAPPPTQERRGGTTGGAGGNRGQGRPDLPSFEDGLQKANEAFATATDRRADAGARLKQLQALHEELAKTLRKLAEAEEESGPLRNLAALFDAKNSLGLDLETFAIGALFDQVLEAANQRLGPMTASRYRLEREVEVSGRGRRGLRIQVFDMHTGKARPTATLSGGESFIAALALALGLADVVESSSGRVRLDTIFIDEEFGSLDTENGTGTLDQVLQVLSALVSQNRAVGLISHVAQVPGGDPQRLLRAEGPWRQPRGNEKGDVTGTRCGAR